MDNIVIAGFKPAFSSYSRAASYDAAHNNHEHSPAEETIDIEEQVVDLLNDCSVPISSDEISICHTLLYRNPSARKSIVIRLKSRKAKIRILRTAAQNEHPKRLKVYVNEHLTAKNVNIARLARDLVRRHKIEKKKPGFGTAEHFSK